MNIPLRLLEMMASKVCHDLISPVSAVNNGVELITEVGGDVVEEATKLIANSAEQAARKLKLFRLCYGRAGSEANVSYDDLRQIAEDHFQTTKITLNWPADNRLSKLRETHGGYKMFLNILLLAEELLPYGGTITVVPVESDAVALDCTIEVAGRGATINPATLACLEARTPTDEVTPRTIHAALTRCFADGFDFELKMDEATQEKVVFWLENKRAH